ncbi:tRNA(Ile)-lysidine synthetase [Serratia symbiotica str. 'Cinara cedri']|nr:tRNA(Ile)-lysidine synthetase [Serratia symbiotica str. 'Cinara cedri']
MEINKLVSQVLHQLSQHRKLLVAFSGGMDSTVLLHLLVQLRQKHPEFQLRALHVHHGINMLADTWVDFCEQQCKSWQVPLKIQLVKLAAKDHGIEAAARVARYTAFNTTLQVGEVLITAHHLDDQSETFLLALKRGSGPSGLSSMAVSSRLVNYLLLRPFLNCSRMQLKNYAEYYKLSWIEDDSNKNTRFDRNFLRLYVLPLLNKRWPYFTSAVARSASLCSEQEKLLDELLAERLHTLLAEDHSLVIDGLLRCSPVCRYALLRRWISIHGVILPSRKQLQYLWDEVACSRIDAAPRLQLGSYQIRRFRGRLYLLPLMANIRNIQLNWLRISPLSLPDGLGILISGKGELYLRAPQPSQKVSIRFSAHGSLRILGRTHSRPIKKLWQELAVAPWLRERTPLVYYDEQLIAALGVFICEEGRVLDKEQPWRLHWNKNHDYNT